MIYRKPHYFNDFKCIADACEDTCCAGWQIVIDEKTLDKYASMGKSGEESSERVGKSGTAESSEPFVERLNNSIDWVEGCYLQDEKRRCAMLNEQGLCDQVLALGEESLCDTCHLYPRHVEEYDGVREWSLSLSCPVAAHMVLTCEEPVRFLEEEDELDDPLEDEFEDFDFFLYTQLEDAEIPLFEMLQNREYSIGKRMAYLLECGRKMQEGYDEDCVGEIAETVEKILASEIPGGMHLSGASEIPGGMHLPGASEIPDGMCLAEMSEGFCGEFPFFGEKTSNYDFAKKGLEALRGLERLNEDWLEVLENEAKLLFGDDCKGKEDFESRHANYDATHVNYEATHVNYEATHANYEAARNAFFAEINSDPQLKKSWDIFRENFIVTMFYTWFKGAVYDGEIYAKIALTVFCIRMIEELLIGEYHAKGNIIQAEQDVQTEHDVQTVQDVQTEKFVQAEQWETMTRRFLREIEHSRENLLALEEVFKL